MEEKTFVITSGEDLRKIKENYIDNEKKYTYNLLICAGSGCISSGCVAVKKALAKELADAGISDKVNIKSTGCMGMCFAGPTLIVEPDGVFYCKLKPEDMKSVVQKHLVGKQIVEELCYVDDKSGKREPLLKNINFIKRQQKNVLRKCGKIELSDINDYIANDGYFALLKVLTQMTPELVIDEMKKSGLRGRGGGGFLTGLKWELARKSPGEQKYIICNADEGDPGAFMDRSLMDGDPHSIIEGMAIGGYAVGADMGYVYIRAENPLAIERLKYAVEKAQECGILGKKILGTNFNFDIEVRTAAGAYVCGEETALMNSVEGRRGEPHQKPPFPSEVGLFGKPTVINNVETFGNITQIILKGSDWFASIGNENAKGTKVFAVAGDINHTGLIEVPMGTTLREILFDIGGGIPNGKQFKVVQSGGPAGGCLTKDQLDVKMDYVEPNKYGAMVGSGGLIVMDENTCMVDVARFFMEFLTDESCGKCTACRIGTTRMLEILEGITKGEGKEGDVELLLELGGVVKDTALCGLGQASANSLFSTVNFYRDEYDEHIRKKYCRAGVCDFSSDEKNACPAGAVKGEK